MSPLRKIKADEGLSRFASDLNSGVWREHNADIPALDALDVGYRLLLWKLEES
jgi:hypothetical protein